MAHVDDDRIEAMVRQAAPGVAVGPPEDLERTLEALAADIVAAEPRRAPARVGSLEERRGRRRYRMPLLAGAAVLTAAAGFAQWYDTSTPDFAEVLEQYTDEVPLPPGTDEAAYVAQVRTQGLERPGQVSDTGVRSMVAYYGLHLADRVGGASGGRGRRRHRRSPRFPGRGRRQPGPGRHRRWGCRGQPRAGRRGRGAGRPRSRGDGAPQQLFGAAAGRDPMTPSAEEDRFTEIMRRHGRAVLTYLARRVDPPHDAADLTAEVFIVVWRRLAAVPPDPEEARAWLLGVARGMASNHRRGSVRHDRLAARLRDQFEVDAQVTTSGRAADVRAALERMDAEDRELLTLIAWDDLTSAQAGAVLGLSPAAVRKRLQRARARLRAGLGAGEPSSTPAGRH